MNSRAPAACRVAAIQMVSAPQVGANLEAAGRLIAAAAAQGAQLVALPEYFCILGQHETDKLGVREKDAGEDGGGGPIQSFLAQAAKRHKVWLIGGTLPIASRDAQRVRSACYVFDADGARVARYDKIHLFAFSRGVENYDETRTMQPGDTPVVVQSPFGRLGLSVCYDVRFPELYRTRLPVDIWFVPSAFTATTGAAHWETLLRARAIENLCYVVAPAQGGLHPNGRRTHGHTMIVGPWGEVLAEQAEGEAVVIADIDHARIAEVRGSLPALDNRRIP
ncbi:MAG: carbon-nitrogen hydrolase family protein [Betaproteobacteria bacterium]|nr:carbon-nitrogen hydrolase family protein [Betaproteobacteria bacterium]